MTILRKILMILLSLGLLAGISGAFAVVFLLWYFGQDLPDYSQLASYNPPTSTRVHAADGHLIAEFAVEKRVFVPVNSIPKRVKQAFIAAEDQSFYSHIGVDFAALARAMVTNVGNAVKGRKLIGASTITQQVAKNFLLSNEVTVTRKIKEAILAVRIEKALSKDRILELYLNEIYLGIGSYGVAAAALNYFDKSLDDLTVAEAAYLAALPKAPNNYHPTRFHDAAIARRNWVVSRMVEEGFITLEEAGLAYEQPLQTHGRNDVGVVDAAFFVEDVRRELAQRYGEEGLYGGGYSVRTTLDSRLQALAEKVMRDGLLAYDRRHGYAGPLAQIDPQSWAENGDWLTPLQAQPLPLGNPGWWMAVVVAISKDQADIGLRDGRKGVIALKDLEWARHRGKGADGEPTFGSAIKQVGDALQPGDVILVAEKEEDGAAEGKNNRSFTLQQIPKIDGALVAMDPHTGRVLAMSGGWSFERSEFNRATQAYRQPGSSFKPFVYLAALEKGYTPATIILDAPFVIDQGPGLGKWKPSNFSGKFYGPSPMRLGIEKSRNLMTVRLAQAVGMDRVADVAARFHIMENMPEQLSMSLGAGAVRLIDMVNAYAILVNGGKEISATLIDRIQDRRGVTIYRHDGRPCPDCRQLQWQPDVAVLPEPADDRKQIVESSSAYQIVSMLEGVVQRGTGRSIAELGRPLGGKTGTTNDSRDVWFIGFSPDLVVGVFVGYDEPTPLGKQLWGGQETGSSVAAPVFKAFMAEALKNKPIIPFRTPASIRLVRINQLTGALANPGEESILEAFKIGTEPVRDQQLVFINSQADTPDDGSNGDGNQLPDENGLLPTGPVPITPIRDGLERVAPAGLY